MQLTPKLLDEVRAYMYGALRTYPPHVFEDAVSDVLIAFYKTNGPERGDRWIWGIVHTQIREAQRIYHTELRKYGDVQSLDEMVKDGDGEGVERHELIADTYGEPRLYVKAWSRRRWGKQREKHNQQERERRARNREEYNRRQNERRAKARAEREAMVQAARDHAAGVTRQIDLVREQHEEDMARVRARIAARRAA